MKLEKFSSFKATFCSKAYLNDIIADSDKIEELTWNIKCPLISTEDSNMWIDEMYLGKVNMIRKGLDYYTQTLNAVEGVLESLESLSYVDKSLLFDEEAFQSFESAVHAAETFNQKLDVYYHTENPFEWGLLSKLLGKKGKSSILRRLERVKINLTAKVKEIERQRDEYFDLTESGWKAEWTLEDIERCLRVNNIYTEIFATEIGEFARTVQQTILRTAKHLKCQACYQIRDLRNVFRKILKTHYKSLDEEGELVNSSAKSNNYVVGLNILSQITTLIYDTRTKVPASACSEAFKI